ncbi:RES family NAD+ phosphorylase [uncultured Salinisphaera sp.]|uniref:RES family NAD+ phosphorylase n=1 Tax=uncultured Salinisphaera sp. TaxID=359372 RepID=UPI0032B2E1CC
MSGLSIDSFERRRVRWRPSYRIVPSRFPPRGLFDRVADPADLEATFAVESLTNDRLRDEVGELSRVPADERMSGPGATPVMAAFTHVNPAGSRFSDGSFGVFYAAKSEATAVRETVFHRERFLADSAQPPMTIEMRVYQVALDGRLRDLRDEAAAQPLLDAHSYVAAQHYGVQVYAAGESGIVYPSVRDPGGECVAAMRARALSPAVQGRHFGYIWDGERITDVVTLGESGIAPHG